MCNGREEGEGAPCACMSKAETSSKIVSMSGEGSPTPTLVARVMMGRTTRMEKRETRERM
eukprot:6284930-Prorocentrum_lima.AAC.1